MASNLEMLDDQTNRKLIASLKLTFDDIVVSIVFLFTFNYH